MKKIIVLSLTLSSIITMSANANYLKEKELKNFNELPMIKKANAEISSVYDNDSLYIANIKVQNNSDTVFITKDKKYLIAGNVIDINTGKTLAAPITNLDIAKGKESYVFGSGKKEYYIFTDPECPFCKELEKYLPQIEKDVKLNIFYFPLLRLHPNARELAKFQLSLKDKNQNVLENLAKTTSDADYGARSYTPEISKILDEKLDEQQKIGETFGVRGTPMIINAKGEMMNWVEFLNEYNIQPTLSR